MHQPGVVRMDFNLDQEDGAHDAKPSFPCRPPRSASEPDRLQSQVRTFLSTTAFTPYAVREWKYSLKASSSQHRGHTRDERTGGFLEAAASTASGPSTREADHQEVCAGHVTGLPAILPLSPSPPFASLSPRPTRHATSATASRCRTSHYRKIEDLSRFLRGDTNEPDTSYFKDAMERRLEREAEAQSAAAYGRQDVLSLDQSDPRFYQRADHDGSEARRRAKALALPPRITHFHQKFLETTALVRPYALGENSVRTATSSTAAQSADTRKKALDTFILTMQCQRPTKGVSAPY